MDQYAILQEAVKQGIIDLQTLSNELQMKEERRYLEQHPYTIWQGSDGRWGTYVCDGEKRKQITRKTKEALEAFLIEFYRDHDPKKFPTFEDEYYAWIASRKAYREVKPTTILRYQDEWDRSFEGTDLARTKMTDLTDTQLDEFIRKSIVYRHLTAKSYAGLRTVMMGVLKYAKRYHHIDFSPAVFFRDLQLSRNMFERPSKKRKNVYKKEERATLYEYLMGRPTIHNLGLALLCLTGLRIGELSTLKKSDNIENCRLLVLRTETRTEVNGKRVFVVGDTPKLDHEGDIAIPKAAQRIIDMAYMQTHDHEYLFTDKEGRRITAHQLRRYLQKACKAAGIEYRPPHQMRKTFASILLASGVDEAIIKKEMRHTDISTTRSYYQFITDTTDREKSIIDRVMGL